MGKHNFDDDKQHKQTPEVKSDISVPESNGNEGQNSGDNPFDPENLKLSQDFATDMGVKKILSTIPVRKPTKQEFVRVHPDKDYRLETAVIELKEDREVYLVDKPLWNELAGEISPKLIITTMNRQGVLSLWTINLPKDNGHHDNWSRSAMMAAKMAESKWIKLSSNMSLGAYETFEALGNFPEPEWPDLSFAKILEIAFGGKHISSLDHPVIKKLRGEI